MKTYVLYEDFCCEFLYGEEHKKQMDDFRDGFSSYYQFSAELPENTSVCWQIKLKNKKVEEKTMGNSMVKLIHSSHSRTDKYLLNGTKHTQMDANRYARSWDDSPNVWHIILDTNNIVCEKKSYNCIEIFGTHCLKDIEYVYETLLNSHYEQRGGVMVHAASCLLLDQGVLICGPSGSGKTTLLMNAIYRKNAIFQANDRVAIVVGNDGRTYCIGIPIPVNVPIKMLKSNSVWKENSVVKEHSQKDDIKIRFLVKDIPKLFPEYVNGYIPLKRILITDYSKNETSVNRMNTEEALKELELLSPFDPCHPKWLFHSRLNLTKDEVYQNARDIISNIEVYRVSGEFMVDEALKLLENQ